MALPRVFDDLLRDHVELHVAVVGQAGEEGERVLGEELGEEGDVREGNALAALPLTILDRGRDRIESGGRRFRRLQPAASRASNGLAAVAGRVERARPLRRGEDPSTHRG